MIRNLKASPKMDLLMNYLWDLLVCWSSSPFCSTLFFMSLSVMALAWESGTSKLGLWMIICACAHAASSSSTWRGTAHLTQTGSMPVIRGCLRSYRRCALKKSNREDLVMSWCLMMFVGYLQWKAVVVEVLLGLPRIDVDAFANEVEPMSAFDQDDGDDIWNWKRWSVGLIKKFTWCL